MTEELEDVEVNNSPYPDSVKAGIPKLAPTPKGWERAPLKKYLYEVRRPAKLKNEEKYKLVTVKRSRGGAEEREWLTGKQIKTKTQFFVEEGDFLISKRQIVHGACAIVPKELHGAVVSNEYCILHSNGGIDIGFLNYLSHTLYFQQTCFHSSIGVHVEKMIFRQNKWLDWEFNIPPIEEQHKITNILSKLDEGIEQLAVLVSAKKYRKKALVKRLFDGNWPIKKISDFTDCTAGGTPDTNKDEYWGGAIRWMSSGELNLKQVSEVKGRITEQGLKKSSTKIVPENSVLIGLAGQGKTRGTVAINLVPLCINQSIAAIFPSSTFVSLYLYHNLDSRYEELRSLSTGDGGRGGLNLKIIRAVQVPLPPIKEQTRIATILSAADREIDQLTQKLDAYKLQKKGLMQQLLTGKKRVSIAKSEAA